MRLLTLLLMAFLPLASAGLAQGTKAPPAAPPMQPGAPPVSAPTAPPYPTLAAALPMQAAGFTRAGLTDFESRPGGQGLGAAAEYRPSEGGSGVATLYQYTRGIAALPEGTTSHLVEQEIQAALTEIRSVGPLRRYGLANLAEAPFIPAPDGQPALRCMGMLLVYEGGSRAADSFICVGVLHGRFLKLRLTLPTDRQGDGQPRLLALGRAVVAALVKAG